MINFFRTDDLAIKKNIYQVRENCFAKDNRISEVMVKEQELLVRLGVKLS